MARRSFLTTRLSGREGWWKTFDKADRGQRSLAELEGSASAIRVFTHVAVPGLLQTKEYARVRIMSAVVADTLAIDADNTLTVRMRRQRVTQEHDQVDDAVRDECPDLEVAAVHSGVEALLFIGERKPDLVILDIMIPGMNGIDVCQKLRSNPSTENIKVVAITGSHNPEIKDRILDAGADLFCTKPLDLISFRDQCLELIRP